MAPQQGSSQNADHLRVVHEAHAPRRRERRLLWASMIIGLILAGAAFCYKIAEFIFTISGDDAKGFADVPVTVYFVVATGWLLLLAWSFMTGKFAHHDAAKYEMLAQEEIYERRGE